MAPVPSSEPMAASFQVLVLGPFALQRNGVLVDVSEWSTRVQRLIRMLATAPGRRCLREEVIDHLWPEATPQAGSSNLRYILHFLRRAFPSGEPPPVLSEHGWIMLNPFYRWEVDLERFEALAQAADDQIEVLEEAVALYRGECLLEDRYEEWAAPLRRRAERIWRDLCIHLARVSRARGDHTTAARHLEPIRITRRRVKQSSHRQSGQTPDNFPVFYPNEPGDDETDSSRSVLALLPNDAL